MAAGVSLLSELPPPSREAHTMDRQPANSRVPTAKYTKVGERLRHVIPGHMQCSMTCGGKACKYENPSRWSDDEQAVKGLYSSWITDNLLAMARPSTDIIEKYNIIDQFQRCGLKTVINLQRPGEHASCGNALEPTSGFTYRPETFMEAGIYFYNFGWKDYGVASLTTILDMVKVMSFAIQEGKMAVHCHAGLGRTGVLLACYLVFTARMTADQAILFVRAKRPNSIQTRGQLLCVREFAQFLVPLRSVFSTAEPRAHAVTLSQYLTRQRHMLHGYEARQMKNVPKIVQLVCGLLLDIAANRQVVVEDEVLEVPDLTAEVEKTVSQQAIQQLGKEMRGKGILVPLPRPSCPLRPRSLYDQPLASDNELDLLWRRQHLESPLESLVSGKRILSYSDSALHQLGSRWEHFGSPLTSELPLSRLNRHYLSQTSLTAFPAHRCSAHVGEQKLQGCPNPESAFCQSQERQQKGWQCPSTSVSEDDNNGSPEAPAPGAKCGVTGGGVSRQAGTGTGSDTEVLDEVPVFTLQSELSPEDRRLLVARALAMDTKDKDLSHKISAWQVELNSREGAWERMCLERDPVVLSGLMWSWLEQLREPIISTEDVQALMEKNYNPQQALLSLEKGHRQTLLCVLDCAARLLTGPEDVEAAFLDQTIQVFTKTAAASGQTQVLHQKLKAVLTPLLHQMRDTALTEREAT